MQKVTKDAVDALLAPINKTNPSFVVIGMQEVAHVETISNTAVTWQRFIFDWIMKNSEGMVLLSKTYQATNQVTIFVRRKLLAMIQRIDFRFSRNTMRGLTGHKGSIGVKISLRNSTSIVFIVSHFIHDVNSYDRRIAQYISNKTCTFSEDSTVKFVFKVFSLNSDSKRILIYRYKDVFYKSLCRSTFWLGDLNFRVEKNSEDVVKLLKENREGILFDSAEQLKKAQRERKALFDFKESIITFKPTYRVFVGSAEYDLKRTPSWCDRILYKGDSITPVNYFSNSNVLVSDHIPVYAVYDVKITPVPTLHWDVLFEHLPTWYTTIPVIGRFQLKNDFWSKSGSYMDWIGIFPVSIEDCTTALKWVWMITCYEQTVRGERYVVYEFTDLPEGRYRLGYYSSYNKCLIGISKSFQVRDPSRDYD